MPATFFPDLAERVLDGMRHGRLLVDICDDPSMPSRATVYRWRTENEDFRKAFADARESQAHCLAEDAVKEVENCGNDWQGARLRFDAKRWFVSKILPRVFGDKPEADPVDQSLQVVIREFRWKESEEEKLAREARELKAAAEREERLPQGPVIDGVADREPDPWRGVRTPFGADAPRLVPALPPAEPSQISPNEKHRPGAEGLSWEPRRPPPRQPADWDPMGV